MTGAGVAQLVSLGLTALSITMAAASLLVGLLWRLSRQVTRVEAHTADMSARLGEHTARETAAHAGLERRHAEFRREISDRVGWLERSLGGLNRRGN